MRHPRTWIVIVTAAAVLTATGAACGAADERVSEAAADDAVGTPAVSTTAATAATTATTAPSTTTTTAAPTTTAPPRTDLYAFTRPGMFAPQVADVPHRVYVPNSDAGTLTVLDPANGSVIRTVKVGSMPHHVTPSWDLSVLYALDTSGNALYPINPRTADVGPAIPVEDPYNLYFTPDGKLALVIAERYQRIDARDPKTWELKFSVSVPHPGVNHGDFSADGRYFYASCEFSGWVVKVDLVERRVVAEVKAGIEPIDVKFSPDASKLYVADQGRAGVMVLDPADLHERAFIPTARGTHGLYPSRDATRLYATNRTGGSVSVIDFATDKVVATWPVPGGGSPDMGSVSPDGTRFWVTGRYHAEVYAFDTATGEVALRIKAGAGAHGLSYFPQPGRYSLGHTGSFR